jgi:peptidoglycan hydrolase-like protein with peptidoglycan-binding domain
MPAGRPIYFAVDWDATDAQKPAIANYLKGAAQALGGKQHVGVYGSYYVVKYMLDHDVVDYGWQTYAWSGGLRDKRAQIYQRLNGQHLAGLSVDFNTAYHEDFGQWRPGHIGHAPAFPFPATDYIAVKNGDSHAHSGDDPGDRPKIKKWEHRMVERGWHLKDDGVFDEEADQVARKFQREKGLTEDGKVGPRTWEAAWVEPVT